MNYLTKNKHWDLVEDYNIDKLLYLLIDRPNLVDNNFLLWKKYKIGWHRDYDLPACFHINDELDWYRNNRIYKIKSI